MVTPPGSPQGRSARHYLTSGEFASRVQTTVALAARSLGYPIAMVNILDDTHQHTITALGATPPEKLPRRLAFCDTVVRNGEPVVVRTDPTPVDFVERLDATDLEIGTYVGVPLVGRESLVVGTLCLIDPLDREVPAADLEKLSEYARIVEDQLDLARRLADQRAEPSIATARICAAVREGFIVPWYQPILSLDSGRVAGFEALARWVQPDGTVVDPARFVPLAEDSDLIIDLDLAIISAAVAQLGRWQLTDPDLRMSVNVSGRHFQQPDGVARILEVCRSAPTTPGTIDIELTESAQIPVAGSMHSMEALRDDGLHIWLDDFGTGWSALDYLLRMPINGIKIDQALTASIGSRVGDAVLGTVTHLAAELELEVIAEGIQTVEQADRARHLGITHGQGFLWSPAMPASAAGDFLRADHRYRSLVA